VVELSDGQAVPTIQLLYVPVHRSFTWAGPETLITLIGMSDQLSARHDFNLLGAGLLIQPVVSRDDVFRAPHLGVGTGHWAADVFPA
jgi:hypothetical protein